MNSSLEIIGPFTRQRAPIRNDTNPLTCAYGYGLHHKSNPASPGVVAPEMNAVVLQRFDQIKRDQIPQPGHYLGLGYMEAQTLTTVLRKLKHPGTPDYLETERWRLGNSTGVASPAAPSAGVANIASDSNGFPQSLEAELLAFWKALRSRTALFACDFGFVAAFLHRVWLVDDASAMDWAVDVLRRYAPADAAFKQAARVAFEEKIGASRRNADREPEMPDQAITDQIRSAIRLCKDNVSDVFEDVDADVLQEVIKIMIEAALSGYPVVCEKYLLRRLKPAIFYRSAPAGEWLLKESLKRLDTLGLLFRARPSGKVPRSTEWFRYPTYRLGNIWLPTVICRYFRGPLHIMIPAAPAPAPVIRLPQKRGPSPAPLAPPPPAMGFIVPPFNNEVDLRP